MAYYKQNFTPKKPVHTFRDLEVYQRTMECSVLIVKDLRPSLLKLKYHCRNPKDRAIIAF